MGAYPRLVASRVEQRQRARAEREARERAEQERARRRRRLIELGALLGAAVLAVAVLIAVSAGGAAKKTDRSPTSSTQFAGIAMSGASLGDPKAPLTMLEFADLQCPFCAEFDRNVLPTLVDRYVRTGKLRIEFRPLRFLGQDSVRAASVASAVAAQDKLWPFVDAFYHRQKQENSGYVTDDFLREVMAAVPGLDSAKALSQADSPQAAKLPAKAEADANAAGISSTPSFMIGPTGGKLSELSFGSIDPGEFTKKIDAALASR